MLNFKKYLISIFSVFFSLKLVKHRQRKRISFSTNPIRSTCCHVKCDHHQVHYIPTAILGGQVKAFLFNFEPNIIMVIRHKSDLALTFWRLPWTVYPWYDANITYMVEKNTVFNFVLLRKLTSVKASKWTILYSSYALFSKSPFVNCQWLQHWKKCHCAIKFKLIWV